LGCCRSPHSVVAGARQKAATPEPPPPLIEPELARGSRLVDPRADELVRQMSERLARVAAFTLEAEEVYDEVPIKRDPEVRRADVVGFLNNKVAAMVEATGGSRKT
jgi:hypothetical protein